MTYKTYLKMRYFIEECDTEVAGLGKVREVEYPKEKIETPYEPINNYAGVEFDEIETDEEEKQDSYLEIYDIEVLPQLVTGITANLDEESMAKFVFNKLKKGESTEEYKVWWHSHVDMGASFSSQDVDTIDASSEYPYLISIVSNKQKELTCRLDIFNPIRHTIEDLDIEILPLENSKLRSECRKQLKENLTLDKWEFKK